MENVEYQQAVTEVLAILDHTEKDAINKIPQKFIEFLKENSSKTYNPNFEYGKPFNQLNLKPKARALLGVIYLKYWANEQEKEEFKKKTKENEIKYQNELREKYNPDTIFNNRENIVVKQEEKAMVEVQKETFIQRVLNKIKRLFRTK